MKPLHIRARELFDLIDSNGGGRIERACELADLLADVAAAPTSDLHRLAMERATTVLEALVAASKPEWQRAAPSFAVLGQDLPKPQPDPED